MGQKRIGQDKTGRDERGEAKKEQDRAGQDITAQDKREQDIRGDDLGCYLMESQSLISSLFTTAPAASKTLDLPLRVPDSSWKAKDKKMNEN